LVAIKAKSKISTKVLGIVVMINRPIAILSVHPTQIVVNLNEGRL
jgi:hypothetical protein